MIMLPMPAGHGVHTGEPEADEYVPPAHCVQVTLPASENDPGGQPVHDEREAPPDEEDTVPAGHEIQEVTEIAPEVLE